MHIYGNKLSSAKSVFRLAGCLALVIALLQARPAQAVVHSSIVVDAQTGRVLHAYHADERAHPASLTKLMTLYITFQRLADGRMTLGERLNVSRHAADQQPSKLGLRAGTTVSVRTCIMGIVSHSANDAAVVLAENIGGSETRFAHMMNQEARQLGMDHTVYYNASGLPNYHQWTTARDMATLALSIIQTYPQYYHYFSVRSFRYRGHTFYSYDHLAHEYRGADGMKTGYIHSSGFNLVTSAMRDHHRIIGVVFGGRTAHSRDVEMVSLLNRGFRDVAHAPQEIARATPPQPRPQAHPEAHPAPHPTSDTAHRRVVKVALVRKAAEAARHETRDAVIEIGGNLHSSHEVRHILHSARLSAPTLRHHGRALVVRLRGRRYRARFEDLSASAAFQSCSALRHKGYTCTILQGVPHSQAEFASDDHDRTTLRK